MRRGGGKMRSRRRMSRCAEHRSPRGAGSSPGKYNRRRRRNTIGWQSQIQSEPPPQILITSDRWSNWLMTIRSNHLMITSYSVASETTSRVIQLYEGLPPGAYNYLILVVKLYQFVCQLLDNMSNRCQIYLWPKYCTSQITEDLSFEMCMIARQDFLWMIWSCQNNE